MLACGDVRVLKAIVLHVLEEDAAIRTFKGAFKVQIYGVYVILEDCCVFIHHDVCCNAIVDLSMSSEAVNRAAKYAFGFKCVGLRVLARSYTL